MLTFMLCLGQASASDAAYRTTPVGAIGVDSDIVIGDTGDALPTLSNVTIEPTAQGFDVAFDYEHYADGEAPAWGPVRLGIYEGDATAFPFSGETVVSHGYGSGPGASLVDETEISRTGHVSRSFEHSRSGVFTVMLFTSERCDCPGGTVFAAGRTLAPAELAPLTTAVPVIVGNLAVGYRLTASTDGWAEGTAFGFQWFVGGTPVAGATERTLVLTAAHANKGVEVRVDGSLAGHAPASRTSERSALVVTPGTPSIAGLPMVGSVLTAGPGAWATGTAVTYQWFADGAPVPGATGRTFTLTTAQDGKALHVAVTASKPAYATVTRGSAATKRVMRWSSPGISGYFAYGQPLTARPGVWTTGATLRYQWFADGRAVAGATTATLKLGTAQRDRRISVSVTGSKAGHLTVGRFSAQSARVLTAGTPTVAGTPMLGGRMTARPGTWSASTSLSYAWLADGVVIPGATGSTYTLGSTTSGKRISVRVTGRKSGYATIARVSAATLRVPATAAPSVAGSTLVTYALTARPGAWTAGTTFRYQWFANGAALSGATASTLRLGTGVVGKKISVRVTGSKAGFATVARTSGITGAVGYPSRTVPISLSSCPSWAPIKGNASSMIYHMPGGAYYAITNPEECFRTQSAAVAAGYRASKR
ncbi:sunset domain-containing protein [Knoellia sp. LjRoot47]|uniref:sunset domain-containing protein n=1 Tax=Knoellia sp. LjRoot47 TaxID=3342330 RepID=UPI003ECF6251